MQVRSVLQMQASRVGVSGLSDRKGLPARLTQGDPARHAPQILAGVAHSRQTWESGIMTPFPLRTLVLTQISGAAQLLAMTAHLNGVGESSLRQSRVLIY